MPKLGWVLGVVLGLLLTQTSWGARSMLKPKLIRFIDSFYTDPALEDPFALLLTYDKQWGARSPKGPPPKEDYQRALTTYQQVRQAVQTKLTEAKVTRQDIASLSGANYTPAWAEVLQRVRTQYPKLIQAMKIKDYRGFQLEDDSEFLTNLLLGPFKDLKTMEYQVPEK